MKYRILSDKELKELEGEFKHFLITNNVLYRRMGRIEQKRRMKEC